MESVLRRFGIKKGEPRDSEARQKLQKELFQFSKCSEHGFPNKPSALAYDPKLKLLAIGTKSGAVRVFGKAGVEFSGQHEDDVSVTQMFFLPDQGRLVSLCSDNSLHLWEVNDKDDLSFLEEVRQYSMENIKLKTISACCLTNDNEQIMLGTEGGNVHQLTVSTFKLTDQVIYQDAIIQNVPDDFKVNPGAVESIQQHPTDAHKFLIGFNRGLVVLWNSKESTAEQTYNASQQLESVSWHRDGTQFMSAHADGSYIIWSASDSTKPKEQATTPYGPFPCKAINKVEWKSAKADALIAFSGGMPRASYGDRHTVSVMQGGMHVVFDFTSRVVDFVVLNNCDEQDDYQKGEYDDPHSLIVLAEEEVVAIDLQSEGWQAYKAPYLASLHSSAITCAQHVANVPEALWNKIVDAGEAQAGNHSAREWPILGGKNLQPDATSRDLLLTGHEDGSVRFWDASTTSVSLLYKLTTANFFGTDMAPADITAIEDEEWPPFRKVGTFDPYSDDPRLGVLKIQMCALSETLVLGGTAGQVVVCQFEREEREIEVKVTSVNVVSDRDNFVWKGHEALPVRGGDVKFSPGFQPAAIMQMQPPASCTALAFHAEWQLVAAGTAHGFGVFDYVQRKDVATKCTLNPADLTGTGESAMSRRKSFKKSLRESFRRLRKRKSERKSKKQRTEKKEEASGKLEEQKTEDKKEGEGEPAAAAAAAAEAAPATPEKPAKTEVIETESPRAAVERQVESRAHADDTMNSMVRTLYFTDTFLINAQNHTPTLWAGTNAGTIFVYQITVPANDKRETDAVECVLGKEIQLKHRAPVVSVVVIDKNAQPLPAALEVQHELAKAPDMSGGHQVVICSEEQFKIFTLPNLKANNKYKLTAHEGSKVRRVGFVSFRSRSDERYSENDLVCLTNQGELQVFTIPQLRKQMKNECVRKDNVTGINSSVFTQFGEGFFLTSPSEFSRFSLSARFISKPLCVVEIKEGARPPLAEPEPEPEPEPEAPAEPAAAEEEAATPAAAEAGGDGDKAAEGENKPEEGAADGANDSVAVADTTVDSANITMDSVKVHLSEELQSSTIVQSSVTRTVVTKTLVSETTGEGTTTEESTTVVHMSSDSPAVEVSTGGDGDAGAAGAAGAAAGGATNLDDDTKLTKQVTDEVSERPAEEEHTPEMEEGVPTEGACVNTTSSEIAPDDPPPTPADPPPPSDSPSPVDCTQPDDIVVAEETPEEQVEKAPQPVEAEVIVDAGPSEEASPAEATPDVEAAPESEGTEEREQIAVVEPVPIVAASPEAEESAPALPEPEETIPPPLPEASPPAPETNNEAANEDTPSPDADDAVPPPPAEVDKNEAVSAAEQQQDDTVEPSSDVTTPIDAQPQEAQAPSESDSATNGAAEVAAASPADRVTQGDCGATVNTAEDAPTKTDCGPREPAAAVNGAESGESTAA